MQENGLFNTAPEASQRAILAMQGEVPRDNPDDTPDDERVMLVEGFYEESKKSDKRRMAVAQWEEADRLIEGEQWLAEDMRRIEDYQAQLTINFVFPVQETRVAQMTENITQVEVLPRDAADDTFARELDGFLIHEWERQGWSNVFAVTLWQVAAHSTAFIKTYWDIHAEGGRGAVKLEPVSNYDLFIHPKGKIRDGKLVAKYVIHRFDMTRNQMIQAYGVDPVMAPIDAPSRPGPEGKDTFTSAILGEDATDTIFTTGKPSSRTTRDDSRAPDFVPTDDTFEVLECWYMDDELIETEEYDDTERQQQQLKYPNGRVMTIANSRVVYDAPNQFGFFPFVPITERPMVDKIYPKSTVNHLKDPQTELNRRRSQLSDHADLCCNPIMVLTAAAAVEQDSEVGTAPGTKLISMDSLAPGGGVSYLIPPPLGDEVAQGVVLTQQDIEIISGIHEVSQGDDPEQARSGVAIKELKQSARTRTTWQSDNTDVGLTQVYRNVISMYLDLVDQAIKYRFMDPESLESDFGEFNPQARVMPNRMSRIGELEQQIAELQAQAQLAMQELSEEELEAVAMQVEAQIASLQQEIQSVWEMPASDLVSFDISIQTGTRHLTLQALASMVIQLYEMNVVTAQTLLKTLNFPGWQKALQLKQEEQAAIARAQQEVEEIAHERERQLQREKQDSMIELEHERADTKVEGEEVSTEGEIELQAEKHEDALELERLKGEIQVKVAKVKPTSNSNSKSRKKQ